MHMKFTYFFQKLSWRRAVDDAGMEIFFWLEGLEGAFNNSAICSSLMGVRSGVFGEVVMRCENEAVGGEELRFEEE